MRLARTLFFAALLASPAVAQDATSPAAPAEPAPTAPAEPAPAAPAAPLPVPAIADIGPTADRDFWCAIAFSLTTRAAQMNGDTTGANVEAEKSQILFASIVTSMKAKNLAEEQFNALTAQYTAKLLDPFAVPGFTREQCEAAVPEARAAVEAAQAAAPAEPAAPVDPAAPAAPAADAPATEAPAETPPAQ